MVVKLAALIRDGDADDVEAVVERGKKRAVHRHVEQRTRRRGDHLQSGGPLADARGRVLGVNAMIAGTLALAIPEPEVARFVRAAGLEPT